LISWSNSKSQKVIAVSKYQVNPTLNPAKVMALVFSLLISVVIWGNGAHAQDIRGDYNPFVTQAIIGSVPMIAVENNGTGTASFKFGNSGSDPLIWNDQVPSQNLVLVISLSRIVPNVENLNATNALNAIGGTFASAFSWTYDLSTNAFQGKQNRTIGGLAMADVSNEGIITIAYKVVENSTVADPKDGFSVNIVAPSYASSNSMSDDLVSTYTWTEACTLAAPSLTPHNPTCTEPFSGILVNSPMGEGLTYSINGRDYQTSVSFFGLEPGTYQVTVKSSIGCISAPGTVVVSPLTPIILATDDIGTIVNGYVGGTSVTDILLNDILTCGAANIGAVNLTMISSSSPKVRLVGSSVVVDKETPTGFYEIVYQICDKLNPGNCATATVTIPVQNSGPAFLIDAFDDEGKVLGTTGGIAVRNVLANDKLGQAFVDPTKVNLTFISSTNPKITMQGEAVVVAENTPAGTYALVYQISEKLNPTNSDQANVIVIVESASGIDPITDIASFDLKLQNYPNPFSYQTTIAFELPEAGTAILKVYDMVGQEVGQIDQTEFNRGTNKVVWNSVTSQKGMYILRMVYKGRMTAKTITIVN
jgi:hypothetical protein